MSFLNILTGISIYILNLFFEIKYKIKKFLFKINHQQDTIIDDIYFVNKINAIKVIIDKTYIKSLNDLIKYSTIIPLDFIIKTNLINKDESLIEVKYRKHNKHYKFNMEINEGSMLFPIYHEYELKHRNMNVISEIIGEKNFDREIELIRNYGGPLNDFYVSKDLGIPLKNFYDDIDENFPFRDNDFELEDTFLNNYKIGRNNDIKMDDCLILKNTLDNTKVKNDESNRQYILSNYKKFKTSIIKDFMNFIFGKQKEL